MAISPGYSTGDKRLWNIVEQACGTFALTDINTMSPQSPAMVPLENTRPH